MLLQGKNKEQRVDMKIKQNCQYFLILIYNYNRTYFLHKQNIYSCSYILVQIQQLKMYLINFIQISIYFIVSKMDRKTNFIEEMDRQLRQYQIEKINLAQQKLIKNFPKVHQIQAKQTLIDLGDLNQSSCLQDNSTSICRWNNKKEVQLPSQNPIITKRNNLMTQRYHSSQNRLQSLRSYSSRQIPQLKQLLQKLSTPTNKKKKNPYQRGVLTSARRNKNRFQSQQKVQMQKYANQQENIQPKGANSQRRVVSKSFKTLQKKDSQNKNPILYPINENIFQKSKTRQYQKINRKILNHWNLLNNGGNTNQIVQEKQLLQNIIKNNMASQYNSGTKSNINSNGFANLGQYSNNLNYFSGNFRNQQRKKGTLTNLLI